MHSRSFLITAIYLLGSDGNDRELSEPSALTWDDTADEYFHKKLHEIVCDRHTSGPFKPMRQDVSKICQGFSFVALCRSQRVTPGGAFQAALQLALARVSGKFMSVGEVVSIRYEKGSVLTRIWLNI